MKQIFYVRSLEDAKRLAQVLPSLSRVGVIGGGFTVGGSGCLQNLDKEVILFEQAEIVDG